MARCTVLSTFSASRKKSSSFAITSFPVGSAHAKKATVSLQLPFDCKFPSACPVEVSPVDKNHCMENVFSHEEHEYITLRVSMMIQVLKNPVNGNYSETKLINVSWEPAIVVEISFELLLCIQPPSMPSQLCCLKLPWTFWVPRKLHAPRDKPTRRESPNESWQKMRVTWNHPDASFRSTHPTARPSEGARWYA